MNYFVLLLSVICQWFAVGVYLHEALHAQSDTLCRVKCGVAATLYALIGCILLWLFKAAI